MIAAATAPPKSPPYRASVAVALIDDHRCACTECDGTLARSERWPSWRRCATCGCCWKVGLYAGRRLADYFRGGCRPEVRQ